MLETTEVIKAEDFGLTAKQGIEISSKFAILEEEKKAIVFQYNEIIKKDLTAELSIEAKVLDSKMQKHLKSKKDIHTANKSFFLNGGRFVDSIYNVEKVEFDLMRDNTKKIKNYAEDLEKETIEALRLERAELLSEFVDDAYDRVLTNMEEDVWLMYLASKKKIHLDLIKQELENEKERQRLIEEEKAEKKRIELENAKLLEEANQRAKLAEEKVALQLAQQKKIDAENLAKQKVIDDKRIAEEKLAEIARVAKQKVIDDRIAKEKIESDKIKKELEVKKQEELYLIESKKLAFQNELKKGDVEKVFDLIKSLETIKTQFTFKSEASIKMFQDVSVLLDKVIVFIEK
tara:strand:- start:3584 stop:4624 length:1041 start_codon:yes stop_codon:yes gene_type:complete